MDLKSGAESFLAFVGTVTPETWRNVILFVAILAFVLYALRANGFVVRLWREIEETVFANWQLALLGTAAIVLSLASGWRTWDGMRNFTGEPWLSFMITFGIQAVMLIVAWLIGESFATGMSQRTAANRVKRKPADSVIGMMLGLAIVGATFYFLIHIFGAVTWTRTADLAFDWSKFSTVAMYFLMALLVLGAFALSFSRGGDIAMPYVQGARVIARNAVLWVMFLACMGTSVFFSFDSFFTSIFPQEERKRSAELRAQNQVSGIMADIHATISARRVTEAASLFESDGWKAYDDQLTLLARNAQDATGEIERYFLQQVEEQHRGIAEQQERIATAQRGQVGLQAKKISLTEELARIKGDRPGLAAEYAQHKSELDAKAREVDEKRVEALAEDRGVEGTGKQGRGPVYRQRMAELSRLQDEYKIKEERTKDAQKRLTTVETRVTQIERELATIDGDLAKLIGEAGTAEQRIKLSQAAWTTGEGPRLDPSSMIAAFERARAEFRQEPTIERLSALQQICSQLTGALASTPAMEAKARGIDCDPKRANEAAAVMFGLNRGLGVLEAECVGGSRIAQFQSADDLFGFARKCLADSGLPSKDTEDLRTRINFAELNRDDKAHRFVVNWNAFEDGNRLAYLSIAIAIGLDSLIFMAGLFGANAIRSPLSDVPSSKARSAQQLEAIIDTALLPHKLDTARLVLGVMQPITPDEGYTAEIIIHDDDPHAADMRRVMNAGATIGAVRQPYPGHPRYEIRAELFEYLSIVAKREFEANKQHVAMAEMERVISVALLPDIGANAEIVLSHLNPIREDAGFMAEVRMDDVGTEHVRVVRNALNAGATFDRVQRAGKEGTLYFVHGDFYRILARIRGRMLASAAIQGRIAAPSLQGGLLSLRPAELETQVVDRQRQLPDHTRAQNAALSDEALRNEILADLLDAIGVPASAYERLRDERVAKAAVAAGHALHRMANRNLHLRDSLQLKESGWASHLDHVRDQVLARHGNHPAAAQAVDDVTNKVLDLLPALLLSPEAGLLEELIEALELAAGADDLQRTGEQMLLEQLRELQSSDLASEGSWKRARDLIEHFEAGDPMTRPN